MTTLAVLGLPLGGGELLIILAIILVLFGPKRLPQLGKSLGKTMKAIREGVDGSEEEEKPAEVKASADDGEKDAPKATKTEGTDESDE